VLSAVERAFEPLLLLAKVGLLRADRTRDEVAESLYQALSAAAGATTRPVGGRRIGDRVVVRFLRDGHPAMVMGSVATGEREELVIEPGGQLLDRERRRLAFGVSLARLVDLAARLRLRRLASDALTLRWRAAGFRLRWLPGLAVDLGTVAGATVRTVRLRGRTARR